MAPRSPSHRVASLQKVKAEAQQDEWVAQEKVKVRRRRTQIEAARSLDERVLRNVARKVDQLKDSRNLRFNKLYRQKFDPAPWVFLGVGLLFFWMVQSRVWPFSVLIDMHK